MADEAEDDVLDLEPAQIVDDETGEDKEKDGQDEQADDGEDELEIAFGDEVAPASGERETDLVKHLRAEIRERDKRLAAQAKAPEQKIEVGPKPTLESCDYDDERFDREYEAWRDRKDRAEQAETQAEAEAREANEAWANEVAAHEAKKKALKFADVQEAEELVTSALSPVQQAVIIKASDDSAKVIYALSKHPAKLADISKIKDPIKLAAAVAKLEGTIRMTPRRKAPEPEEIARGSASVEAGSDKHLERLEKEADRTGDRTKVIQYRRQLKAKAK